MQSTITYATEYTYFISIVLVDMARFLQVKFIYENKGYTSLTLITLRNCACDRKVFVLSVGNFAEMSL